MMITPKHKDTDFPLPWSLEDKITIFVERTYGWQLDIADKCSNTKMCPCGNVSSQAIPDSGFAVLHIVLSYFEMIAKFQEGFVPPSKSKGESKPHFRKGVRLVFPDLNKNQPDKKVVDKILDVLYSDARCGLYHSGITGSRIVLTGDLEVPIGFEIQDQKLRRLIINPHRLVPALKAHLCEYERQLRNPSNTQLRDNFERRFDFQIA